jgi:hypothetical protein
MIGTDGDVLTSSRKKRLPIWIAVAIATMLSIGAFLLSASLLDVLLRGATPPTGATPLTGTSSAPAIVSPPASPPLSTALTRTERLDIVRLALTVVAGIGGIVALVVSYRRQSITEEAHIRQILTDQHDEYDARERRITELYAQAITQLASERAHIRVGGMYALERLAQDNPIHRQTVLNVLCAYLRTPISLTDRDLKAFAGSGPDENEIGSPEPDIDNSLIEQLHARFAAQRILLAHFRSDIKQPSTYGERPAHTKPTSGTYWHAVKLDLSDTHLVYFDASLCYFQNVDFKRVRLSGGADFHGAYFKGDTSFDYAVIDEGNFDHTEFEGVARFFNTSFGRLATFDYAKLGTSSTFNAARFSGVVTFRECTWADDP